MAPEQITVTVRSGIGEDANLAVTDAMRQILDYFDILEAAGGAEAELIEWQVVAISLNSPLTITAQAIAKKPGIDAAAIARKEKANFGFAFADIAKERRVPDWMNADIRTKAKEFLSRNTVGVGRTDIVLSETLPVVTIAPAFARIALRAIEDHEKSLIPIAVEEDHSRIEYGSVEANLVALTSYYGKPALQVRDRLYGQEFACILPVEAVERIGSVHDWTEIWAGKRAIISGQVRFRKDGRYQIINADSVEIVDDVPIDLKRIYDPTFTGDRTIADHLDSIWEEEVG